MNAKKKNLSNARKHLSAVIGATVLQMLRSASVASSVVRRAKISTKNKMNASVLIRYKRDDACN